MDHIATSLTPPPTQETPMMDAPMPEAPFREPSSTTHHPVDYPIAAAATEKKDPDQQEQYQAPEQAPPMTNVPSASTFPREHPPREPTHRQHTPRLYDNNPPDRIPPHLLSYPTAPDSLPPTPHLGMSAPSASRAHFATSSDRTPYLSSYPTAPGSASQTPQPRTSQAPPQAMSAAGWLVPPPTNPAPRITFEGTFTLLLSWAQYLVMSSFVHKRKECGKRKEEIRSDL